MIHFRISDHKELQRLLAVKIQIKTTFKAKDQSISFHFWIKFQPKVNFKLPLEPVLRKVQIAFKTKEHRAAEHFCTWRVEMTEKLEDSRNAARSGLPFPAEECISRRCCPKPFETENPGGAMSRQ